MRAKVSRFDARMPPRRTEQRRCARAREDAPATPLPAAAASALSRARRAPPVARRSGRRRTRTGAIVATRRWARAGGARRGGRSDVERGGGRAIESDALPFWGGRPTLGPPFSLALPPLNRRAVASLLPVPCAVDASSSSPVLLRRCLKRRDHTQHTHSTPSPFPLSPPKNHDHSGGRSACAASSASAARCASAPSKRATLADGRAGGKGAGGGRLCCGALGAGKREARASTATARGVFGRGAACFSSRPAAAPPCCIAALAGPASRTSLPPTP